MPIRLHTVEDLADIVLALSAHGIMPRGFLLPIVRALAAFEDRDRLARLVRIVGEPVGEAPRASLTVADGLLARLDGKPEEASKLLADGAEEHDRLGRHYDAACVALEVAAAADESGQTEIALAARTRASALLDPLGCVNPI